MGNSSTKSQDQIIKEIEEAFRVISKLQNPQWVFIQKTMERLQATLDKDPEDRATLDKKNAIEKAVVGLKIEERTGSALLCNEALQKALGMHRRFPGLLEDKRALPTALRDFNLTDPALRGLDFRFKVLYTALEVALAVVFMASIIAATFFTLGALPIALGVLSVAAKGLALTILPFLKGAAAFVAPTVMAGISAATAAGSAFAFWKTRAKTLRDEGDVNNQPDKPPTT